MENCLFLCLSDVCFPSLFLTRVHDTMRNLYPSTTPRRAALRLTNSFNFFCIFFPFFYLFFTSACKCKYSYFKEKKNPKAMNVHLFFYQQQREFPSLLLILILRVEPKKRNKKFLTNTQIEPSPKKGRSDFKWLAYS